MFKSSVAPSIAYSKNEWDRILVLRQGKHMKTEDLIRILVEDVKAQRASRRDLKYAILIGVIIDIAAYCFVVGPSVDFFGGIKDGNFYLIQFFILALVLLSVMSLYRIVRPELSRLPLIWWSVATLSVTSVVALGEMAAVPKTEWGLRIVGSGPTFILVCIPFLASIPLACIAGVLRRRISINPYISGATTGLFSGTLAATLCGTYSLDQNALFIVSWYSLAIGCVVLSGAFLFRYSQSMF